MRRLLSGLLLLCAGCAQFDETGEDGVTRDNRLHSNAAEVRNERGSAAR
jgi:hypothetical protein